MASRAYELHHAPFDRDGQQFHLLASLKGEDGRGSDHPGVTAVSIDVQTKLVGGRGQFGLGCSLGKTDVGDACALDFSDGVRMVRVFGVSDCASLFHFSPSLMW